jgi:uncharacterized protein
MLRIDVTEIIRTPGMRQVYDIHEPPYTDEDVEYVSPLVAKLTITNTGSMLLVRGPFRTAVAMECSRCLEPVREPIDVELEEEFDVRLAEDPAHHDKVFEVIEDDVCRVFDGKVFQADVLFRQAALLAMPLQPLCRDDCPGIRIKSAAKSAADESLQNSPFRELSHFFDDNPSS